jgi:hypothetical protein
MVLSGVSRKFLRLPGLRPRTSGLAIIVVDRAGGAARLPGNSSGDSGAQTNSQAEAGRVIRFRRHPQPRVHLASQTACEPVSACVSLPIERAEVKITQDAADNCLIGAGLALGAWLGRAGIDAATGTVVPASRMQLDAVDALNNATEQVRMAGRLLNQAVARLNTNGAPGPELRRYADNVARAVRTLEGISITAARKIL